MPELPEVETVLRGLRDRVVGLRIADVKVLNVAVITGAAEDFRRTIAGRSIAALRRKGKVLAVELRSVDGEAPRYLVVRLGMTGQVILSPREAAVAPHTHLRLGLEGGELELRFRDARRFGRLRSSTAGELETLFDRLGPDAREVSLQHLEETLKGRRGAIKGWLLNQQMLSGLGNIYSDEALFEARIHPRTPAGCLRPDAVIRLHKAIRKVLSRAVNLQGTSFRDYIDIEGRPGRYSARLKAYGRAGESCRRCGSRIRRIVVCGRGSHFCPNCQRPPRSPAPPGRPRKRLKRNTKVRKRA